MPETTSELIKMLARNIKITGQLIYLNRDDPAELMTLADTLSDQERTLRRYIRDLNTPEQ
jgi:hypothetical protein